MSSTENCSNKISVRCLKTIAFTVLVACLCLPATLFGESLVRTVSLEAADQEQNIHIPVGSSITFLNNYSQELFGTSVMTGHSDKKLLSIESFAPGQSFGLEFPRKGPYSICYSLTPETGSADSICLQINVVPLQTA